MYTNELHRPASHALLATRISKRSGDNVKLMAHSGQCSFSRQGFRGPRGLSFARPAPPQTTRTTTLPWDQMHGFPSRRPSWSLATIISHIRGDPTNLFSSSSNTIQWQPKVACTCPHHLHKVQFHLFSLGKHTLEFSICQCKANTLAQKLAYLLGCTPAGSNRPSKSSLMESKSVFRLTCSSRSIVTPSCL